MYLMVMGMRSVESEGDSKSSSGMSCMDVVVALLSRRDRGADCGTDDPASSRRDSLSV